MRARGKNRRCEGSLGGEYPGATLPLGLVHGLVRLGQQLSEVLLARVAARPYRHRQNQFLPLGQTQRAILEVSNYPLQDGLRLRKRVGLTQYQDELVPAPAGQPVALTDVAADDVGYVVYARVARLVAVGIVYVLEAVDVHHAQRKRLRAASDPRGLFGQKLLALPAVEEAGGQVGHLPVDYVPLEGRGGQAYRGQKAAQRQERGGGIHEGDDHH